MAIEWQTEIKRCTAANSNRQTTRDNVEQNYRDYEKFSAEIQTK